MDHQTKLKKKTGSGLSLVLTTILIGLSFSLNVGSATPDRYIHELLDESGDFGMDHEFRDRFCLPSVVFHTPVNSFTITNTDSGRILLFVECDNNNDCMRGFKSLHDEIATEKYYHGPGELDQIGTSYEVVLDGFSAGKTSYSSSGPSGYNCEGKIELHAEQTNGNAAILLWSSEFHPGRGMGCM